MVFVGLVTTPLWHGAVAKEAALATPGIKLPAQEKQCVAPLSYMRTSHMQLLQQWRDDVVRDGNRQFIAYDGKRYDKDLTRTCLTQCHADRREFCDRCHTYSGVATPSCWDCHNAPQVVAGRMP